MGKNEMADFYYKIAIDIEPDNAWYISHYAFFLQRIKEYSRSEYYYKVALNKDKNNSWVSKRYAYFLKELKEKKKHIPIMSSCLSRILIIITII